MAEYTNQHRLGCFTYYLILQRQTENTLYLSCYIQSKKLQIKLITKKLPTCLLLYFHNPITHPNYLCPRCYLAPEDYAHLLMCITNPFNFKTKIKRIITRLINKEEKPLVNPTTLVQSYFDLHIT